MKTLKMRYRPHLVGQCPCNSQRKADTGRSCVKSQAEPGGTQPQLGDARSPRRIAALASGTSDFRLQPGVWVASP